MRPDDLVHLVRFDQLSALLDLTPEQVAVFVEHDSSFPRGICITNKILYSQREIEKWFSHWTRDDVTDFIDFWTA